MSNVKVVDADRQQSGTSVRAMSIRAVIGKITDKARKQRERHVPAQGVVSSGFGPSDDSLNGEKSFHNGIDIAGPADSQSKPGPPGKVIFIGAGSWHGNFGER